ncbi:endonuclease/exonuclease/phosphatase family protein [Stenotrophomonas sp. 278]|uniref:endonuclease/exonuclease/phosphatase family protein n=1 Tax=Stenotrophomonas sp. 278 TaxID=2479851 RepID=UPI000F660EF3|nr:endonuclease/exonuclease/phosphatase family protein [Stenotrophomonas sp. 278]RRU13186.1 endonuclease/exonuclease/phosphatase family protein [Stenotrophomonas sp. 278]
MRSIRKRHALWLAFALSLPFGSAQARSPTPAAEPLRVMSFNVRTPVDTEPGRRWVDRRDAMVNLLRAQRPAVVGTQELVQQQAEYLTTQLPDYRWFGQGRRGGEGDEHMGVFYDSTRLKVVESGDFWLSDTPEVPGSITWGNLYPRMVTWALFERVSDRRRFYLLNTHLPYRDDDEPRRVQGAKAIVARLQQLHAGVPVVITGDFNSEPGSGTYATFTAVLGDARRQAAKVEGPRLTFHNFSGTPTTELDWILVRGMKVLRFATLDDKPGGVLPSDHFPVVADVELP